jgi:hypothetical protein
LPPNANACAEGDASTAHEDDKLGCPRLSIDVIHSGLPKHVSLACFLLPFQGVKGLTAAFLFGLAATMASAATIDIRSAYPSDAAGNPVQVALGESFT